MSYLPPPSTLSPGSIVDSYRRDSGGPRQDQSTEQQLVEIQAYCAAHGLVLRHNFVDVARSGGSTVGREDFNRMLDLYRTPSQRPHGLLLWNYARFARDLVLRYGCVSGVPPIGFKREPIPATNPETTSSEPVFLRPPAAPRFTSTPPTPAPARCVR